MEKWGILWRKKHLRDPRANITEEESTLRKQRIKWMLIPGLLQLPYWYEVIFGDRNWIFWVDDLLDLDPVACMFFASMVALPILLIKVNKMEINEEEIRNKDIEKEAQEKKKEKWEELSRKAQRRETALDYDSAIGIWEELGIIKEAARIRKLKSEQGAVKVTQKVVHGDEVTKTEIKDSVLNRSNVGSGGKSKAEQIKEIKDLLDAGAIDDDEFKQMKKEILGK